jgi:prepilin-type N-terminal cleavage/methylation domain-containing protein
MRARRSQSAGFSLIELGVVLVVISIVLAFGAAGFGKYMDDASLNGATDHIASTLLLTRDRAMATRASQTMRFEAGYQGTDYRVEIGGVMAAGWKLPNRITYNWASGTVTAVTMTPDGRCSTSGLIILQNPRGRLDTVSVLSSGLVLTR